MATKSTRQARGNLRRALAASLLGVGLLAPQLALAGEGNGNGVIAAPAAKKPPAPQKPTAITCTLLTTEAPRGGRLEVEGTGFGQAPLVRIAGRVTRMIERTEAKIAVQIPADSDGGAVTVHAGKLQAACGTLTIIGKNG